MIDVTELREKAARCRGVSRVQVDPDTLIELLTELDALRSSVVVVRPGGGFDSYDVSPARLAESAIHQRLIALGWTPPPGLPVDDQREEIERLKGELRLLRDELRVQTTFHELAIAQRNHERDRNAQLHLQIAALQKRPAQAFQPGEGFRGLSRRQNDGA